MTAMRNAAAVLVLLATLVSPRYAHAADPCQLEISGNDQMQYDKQVLTVAASCKQVTVTLRHSGKLRTVTWAASTNRKRSRQLPWMLM